MEQLNQMFFCEVCQRSFSTKSNLKAHKTEVHKGKRLFACTICPRTFKTKGDLKKHGNVHGEKRETCSICSKTFFKKSNVKQHIEGVHEGKKPFSCKICTKSFTQKVSLKSHIEIIHSNIEKLRCDICHIEFVKKSNLTAHTKIFHKTTISCNHCDKKFTSKDLLTDHGKIHNEILIAQNISSENEIGGILSSNNTTLRIDSEAVTLNMEKNVEAESLDYMHSNDCNKDQTSHENLHGANLLTSNLPLEKQHVDTLCKLINKFGNNETIHGHQNEDAVSDQIEIVPVNLTEHSKEKDTCTPQQSLNQHEKVNNDEDTTSEMNNIASSNNLEGQSENNPNIDKTFYLLQDQAENKDPNIEDHETITDYESDSIKISSAVNKGDNETSDFAEYKTKMKSRILKRKSNNCECPKCHKEFSERKDLLTHIITVHICKIFPKIV